MCHRNWGGHLLGFAYRVMCIFPNWLNTLLNIRAWFLKQVKGLFLFDVIVSPPLGKPLRRCRTGAGGPGSADAGGPTLGLPFSPFWVGRSGVPAGCADVRDGFLEHQMDLVLSDSTPL